MIDEQDNQIELNKQDDHEIEWNDKIASALVSEQHYLKGDFIDEPPLLFKKNIMFSDNIWDISDKTRTNCVLYFSPIQSKVFRVLLKHIAIRDLYISRKKRRNSTVYRDVNKIRSFILYLEEKKYMYDLRYITPEIVHEYVEIKKKTTKKGNVYNILYAIKKFLEEMKLAGHDIDLSDYQKTLKSVSWKDVKAERKTGKTPNIPKRILKKTVECALRDMEDESLRIQDRLMACLIVILSFTGMRRGELLRLQEGKLQDISIFDNKKKAYRLEFFTYKTTPAKDGRWTETIAYPETVKAYQTLEKLSEERRIKGKTAYLNVNMSGKRYSETTFNYTFDSFFYRHQKEIFKKLSEHEKVQVYIQTGNIYFLEYLSNSVPNPPIKGETFFTLNPHQFRVYMANRLKEEGKSLQWIMKHINHMSEEMTKHYFRDDLAQETLLRRASEDGNSLEVDPNSQNSIIKNELSEPELLKAYQEINKFLKKNKFNIYKDIDEIIYTLNQNPLRETIVGVCSRHMGILCERQYRLATLEKWYYLSPKVPNIDYFDFTYKRFIEKAKIVQHNKELFQQDSKYQRDYENEYTAFIKFYQNRVLPEQDLFLSMLKQKGKEYILSSYPQLEVILSNIDDVNKEIAKWGTELVLENL